MVDDFLKSISILIVDDNNTDLEVISKSLGRYFKKVHTASNGADAFNIYEENKNIDIIISDINMPKINGIELLKLIRRSDMQIPFLIVSANLDQEILIQAINLNVSSFLPKPINLQSLIRKIDMLCEGKYFKYKAELRKNEINNYLDSVNSVALIYKMQSNGNITYMNESMFEVTGYKEEDLKDLSFEDIIHPDIDKKYIDDTWNTLKEGKLWKGNTKFISKNKEEFHLNNTIFKLDTEEDSYITISFLTTKENLEKRDFHKKVLNSIKEFNIKEFNYKKEIENLKFERSNLSMFSNSSDILEKRVNTLLSQVDKYEKDLNKKDEKYNSMLMSKRSELENHIEKAQKEIIKVDALTEENSIIKNKIELLEKENIKIRETTINLVKRVRELEEVLKIERTK
ncbi:response regulator [Poseidonibacter antarcticus]|uniref:response regulator n=1 Tax=Poseidonibacter antarcticus TaxID=2478538 RepID=UPI000EF50B0E|nr:response regulator [Poseidonibacter antarcticus]